MNTDRHYPQAFKFTLVAMLAFAVFIFFHSPLLMIKLYCVIMFLAILNEWVASESNEFKYSDLFLLNDTICSAMYFMILLELNQGTHKFFWLFSCVIFFMYWRWNKLCENQEQAKPSFHVYNMCNIISCVYSLCTFLTMTIVPDIALVKYIQYIGMIFWTGLLVRWYRDFWKSDINNSKKKK